MGSVNTICDLGVALLSPPSLNIACAVGRFLSEYLAAREILLSSAPFCASPTQVASSRWLGGRTKKLDELCLNISDVLRTRDVSMTALPKDTCVFSSTWIIWHCHESLDDAFKPIRSWLISGWDTRLDRKSKSYKRSLACM